jgi:cation diffusion facilitator CzcD-associated flavoprotein CzcO
VAHKPRVAVVGAGFGGIAAAVAVRDDAEPVVLERGADVGGVWRDNTYPGAACDVPSHLYSFSFAAEHRWSRRFAPQADILAYLRRVVDAFGVGPHLRLHTEVTEARWDDDRELWRLTTGTGETVEAEVLVAACGQLTHPRRPDVPGLASFRGPVLHSARWDPGVALRGRRVAVVGSGASAVQLVPAVADEVAHLTVFARSAAHLAPKPDRRYSAVHRALFRWVPAWPRLARTALLAVFERAGAAPVQPAPPVVRRVWDALLRLQVRDAGLRERLRPAHPLGCRRVLVSSDWYRALRRPHVDLVTAPLTALTPEGVATADGAVHPADVVVLATGFEPERYIAPMKVFGRDGRELSEQWRDGAGAHLGIAVPGFPNLFLVHGPNTALRVGSVVHMIECQAGYVRQAVRRIAAGVRTLEVRREVADAFVAEMRRRHGPSPRPVTHEWPGTMGEYARRTARFADAEFLAT